MALVLLFVLHPDEPAYQNRKLSSWMEDLPPPHFQAPLLNQGGGRIYDRMLRSKAGEAVAAVRQIGTNAVPQLIRYIRRDYDPLPQGVITWINKHKFLNLSITPVAQRRNQAYAALEELGFASIPAWTQILLDESLSIEKRHRAAFSLAALPRDTVVLTAEFSRGSFTREAVEEREGRYNEMIWKALVEGLNAKNPLMRSNSAYFIGAMRSAGKGAIPSLMEHLNDSDAGVREVCRAALRSCEPDLLKGIVRSLSYETPAGRAWAISGLGGTGQPMDKVLPVLIDALDDPAAEVRIEAIRSIERFRRQASNAIPALLKARSDAVQPVREAATNALRRVTAMRDEPGL